MPRCNFEINDILDNKYIINKELGKGSYCNVFEGYNINNNNKVAIKVHKNSKRFTKSIKSEYSIYLKLNKIIKNKNLKYYIPEFYDIIYYKNFNCFILELCGINMNLFIRKNYNTTKYNIDFILKISKNMIKGASFLNDNNIIHCDIKPENILFNLEESDIVICDFGLSKISKNKKEKFVNEIQTIWYRAPEISLQIDFDYKIDIWSLGCIFYEMLFNKILFKSDNDEHNIKNIYNLIDSPNNNDILFNKNYIKFINNISESEDLYDEDLFKIIKDKYKDIYKVNKLTELITSIIIWDSDERPTYEKLKALI